MKIENQDSLNYLIDKRQKSDSLLIVNDLIRIYIVEIYAIAFI